MKKADSPVMKVFVFCVGGFLLLFPVLLLLVSIVLPYVLPESIATRYEAMSRELSAELEKGSVEDTYKYWSSPHRAPGE